MEADQELIAKKVEEEVKKKVEEMVNPIFGHLKDRLNPADQTPLRAGAVRDLPMSQPPLMSHPRPMPPPPPALLPAARSRGILSAPTAVERPKTPHALELEKKAEDLKMVPGQRICQVCGNTKRTNVKKDKVGTIVGYDPCPVCVDM